MGKNFILLTLGTLVHLRHFKLGFGVAELWISGKTEAYIGELFAGRDKVVAVSRT